MKVDLALILSRMTNVLQTLAAVVNNSFKLLVHNKSVMWQADGRKSLTPTGRASLTAAFCYMNVDIASLTDDP